MKEENINGSPLRGSPVPVRTHVARRVKLNDTFIKSLKRKNKLYSYGDSEMVGLRLYVEKTGTKTFYYTYRPKNEKNYVRYKIGSFNVLNVKQARDHAKKYAAGIVDGKEPVQIKRDLKGELTLKELIEKFYKERFKANYGYKPNTVQAVKTCFKVWIFKKTVSRAVMDVQEQNPYDLQHKKLSTITPVEIKTLHGIIRSKSPAVANKVIKFLNVVFVYGIEVGELSINPVEMKKKDFSPDREDNRIFTKEQRKTILNIVWKIDKRTGRINYNYYKEKGLNLVGCCIIAFRLRTGRRVVCEVNKIKWTTNVSLPAKKIFFTDSKVGQMEFSLGPKAVELLKIIYGERLTPGPLLWKEGTKDYVFPSYKYGLRSSKGEKCTKPYFTYLRKTWKRVLKMAQIDYIPPKQCRHTFLTLYQQKNKDLMATQEVAGHISIKTTQRYVKILEEDVRAGLDKMDQEEVEESKVLELKKIV